MNEPCEHFLTEQNCLLRILSVEPANAKTFSISLRVSDDATRSQAD